MSPGVGSVRGSTCFEKFQRSETLGYDAFTGDDFAFPANITSRIAKWHDVTSDPRTYGFHGTQKAPFALANGKDEAELRAACAAFCTRPREIARIELIVASISGFIALIPAQKSSALVQLANEVVEALDMFRAPLSPDDRARRNPSRLTKRQIAYLDRWGYPYVMDEFRFHMTLTGRLESQQANAIQSMLTQRFSETYIAAIAIDRIALFRQNTPKERFRIIKNYPLTEVDRRHTLTSR